MKWRANIRRLFLVGQKKELNLKVFNGITEAPDDGEQYVRKNRRWVKGVLFDYLLKNNEDKGSVAVGAHETEYDHDSFIKSETLNASEFQADSETGVISVKKIDASKVENLPAPPEFISEKITANKTLTVGDGGKHFYSEATVDIEVTVVEGIKEPTSIFQKGAGRVKVVGDDGVTLYGKEWTISQFNGISVVPEDENTYHIIGGSDE